jgi:hypothetical protein
MRRHKDLLILGLVLLVMVLAASKARAEKRECQNARVPTFMTKLVLYDNLQQLWNASAEAKAGAWNAYSLRFMHNDVLQCEIHAIDPTTFKGDTKRLMYILGHELTHCYCGQFHMQPGYEVSPAEILISKAYNQLHIEFD